MKRERGNSGERTRLATIVSYILLFSVVFFQSGCEWFRPQTPATPVQTIHPKHGEIVRRVTLPGNVMAYQEATLYAKVAGYLKTINVDKGDTVKEGDLLAEIEAPEMLADLVKAKAEAEAAQLDYKRVTEAQKKASDLVVPQTVDAAKAKSGVAVAGVAVPDTEAPFVEKDLPVKVTVDELPGRVFDGAITRFAYALDESTKTMTTEIETSNPDLALRPGMWASVEIELQKNQNALLIPAEALVTEKNKNSLFVVRDGKAQKVSVTTGFDDGVNVEILKGCAPGDAVIVAGKQSVTDGQKVKAAEAK
ncbi:MAG: hypothetical protein DME62_08530 [Verrucomicrobia bacterium]|nr:MAG: hypothetical protein DME62_08530 [Verrucomicrobiota bacterium]